VDDVPADTLFDAGCGMRDARYRMPDLAMEYIDVPAQPDSMCGCTAAEMQDSGLLD
jgi:hypothetical protein